MSIPVPQEKVGRILSRIRRKFGQAAAPFSGKERHYQRFVLHREEDAKERIFHAKEVPFRCIVFSKQQ